MIQRLNYWDFSGSPVSKAPSFHCRGTGLDPGQETKIPHAMWHSKKKKKGKIRTYLADIKHCYLKIVFLFNFTNENTEAEGD